MGTTAPADKRLLSLDALRGFDMFWIIGGDAFFRSLAEVTHWGWARAWADPARARRMGRLPLLRPHLPPVHVHLRGGHPLLAPGQGGDGRGQAPALRQAGQARPAPRPAGLRLQPPDRPPVRDPALRQRPRPDRPGLSLRRADHAQGPEPQGPAGRRWRGSSPGTPPSSCSCPFRGSAPAC